MANQRDKRFQFGGSGRTRGSGASGTWEERDPNWGQRVADYGKSLRDVGIQSVSLIPDLVTGKGLKGYGQDLWGAGKDMFISGGKFAESTATDVPRYLWKGNEPERRTSNDLPFVNQPAQQTLNQDGGTKPKTSQEDPQPKDGTLIKSKKARDTVRSMSLREIGNMYKGFLEEGRDKSAQQFRNLVDTMREQDPEFNERIQSEQDRRMSEQRMDEIRRREQGPQYFEGTSTNRTAGVDRIAFGPEAEQRARQMQEQERRATTNRIARGNAVGGGLEAMRDFYQNPPSVDRINKLNEFGDQPQLTMEEQKAWEDQQKAERRSAEEFEHRKKMDATQIKIAVKAMKQGQPLSREDQIVIDERVGEMNSKLNGELSPDAEGLSNINDMVDRFGTEEMKKKKWPAYQKDRQFIKRNLPYIQEGKAPDSLRGPGGGELESSEDWWSQVAGARQRISDFHGDLLGIYPKYRDSLENAPASRE